MSLKDSELTERSGRREKGVNIYLAQYYAMLGDRDNAFLWLEKAVETSDVDLFWLKADPLFRSLQKDKRFADFLARIGLVASPAPVN